MSLCSPYRSQLADGTPCLVEATYTGADWSDPHAGNDEHVGLAHVYTALGTAMVDVLRGLPADERARLRSEAEGIVLGGREREVREPLPEPVDVRPVVEAVETVALLALPCFPFAVAVLMEGLR